MDQETEALLKKMEEDNGGPIEYKTYCRLLGFSDGTSLDLGGLLFVVNDKLVFEDFEKQPGILDMFGKSKKSYEKYKTYRLFDEILGIKKIKTSSAKKVIAGRADGKDIPTISRFDRLFSQTILELTFKEEPNWYIELLEDKEFINYIEEKRS